MSLAMKKTLKKQNAQQQTSQHIGINFIRKLQAKARATTRQPHRPLTKNSLRKAATTKRHKHRHCTVEVLEKVSVRGDPCMNCPQNTFLNQHRLHHNQQQGVDLKVPQESPSCQNSRP